jgi:hypothetical protein
VLVAQSEDEYQQLLVHASDNKGAHFEETPLLLAWGDR